MSNKYKDKYLSLLKNKFGKITKIGTGYSLFLVHTPDIIVYFRYSKIHSDDKRPYTFYGLKKDDVELIKKLNKKSFIILLTSEENKNLYIPFNALENYFHPSKANKDNQYKINHFFKPTGNVISLSKTGKYSTEKFLSFDKILDAETTKIKLPLLSHGQVQSLVGAIGIQQGYDLFFPKKDYNQIDYSIVNRSKIQDWLPSFNNIIDRIIKEIDVIWLNGIKLEHFFEVEHSTPIYSGLLRFNDVSLSIGNSKEFNIVAQDERENKFGLEINRPTFTKSKLIEKTNFISYESIYRRYFHLTGKYYEPKM